MIELRNVTKIYNRNKPNEHVALQHCSLKVEDGEFVAVMGTSGVGKSTLLAVISGIDTFEEGEVCVDGKQLEGMKDKDKAILRNRTFGIIMQDYALVEEFTVFENVLLVLWLSKGRKDHKRLVMETLERVGIRELANRMVNELSGGQKQRVAIARAIVNSPKYILADEPTGALDSKASKSIMNLLCDMNREGQTILLVTHDISVAQRCKRVVNIVDGKIE